MNRSIFDRPITSEVSRIDRDFFVRGKKASIKDRILLSPIVKYVVLVIAVIVILMSGVYLTLYFLLENGTKLWPATCNIKASYRVECFPGKLDVSYDQCDDVGCCWNDETEFCFHSVPSRHGYARSNDGDNPDGKEILVPRTTNSPLGSKNAESLAMRINNIDPNHIEIIFEIERMSAEKRKIHEKETYSQQREFEADDIAKKLFDFVPDDFGTKIVNIQDDEKSKMDVHVHVPESSVTVTRKNDTTASLLSTARGPFILTESFWEFTLFVTQSSIYGLNQMELNGTTNWIYNNENGTARPSFLGIDDNGRGTACYVSYNGPMEIKVLDESNLVVLRGMSLPKEISLHVFAGPSPLEAVSQLTKATRQDKSEKIPVASLGLHVCPNDESTGFIDSLKSIMETMNEKGAPWDSHCLHQGFNPTLGKPSTSTEAQIVTEAVKILGEERSLVPHLSAMLFATNNALASALVENSLLLTDASSPYEGLYRNQKVVYPDWFDPRTHSVSRTYLADYLDAFESPRILYLRDSWPKDESSKHPEPDYRSFDYIPYDLEALMVNTTIPYSLQSSSTPNYHYTEHNDYAGQFRNFVSSDGNWTTLMTRGLWGEAGHSSWTALRAAIHVGVGSCLVGQLPPPMYVCGTSDKSVVTDNDEDLCSRWYGLSVVWPHVLALPANIPGGDHLTATSSTYAVKLLKLRGSLVTYTRTLLARHYIEGTPILSPTSLHYPGDLRARRRWDQFFWGDSILVGLVTLPRVSQVSMWLPGKYPWKHLQGGTAIDPSNINATSITAVRGQIITLIRPGFIIPVHEEISMTSGSTAKSDLTLVTNLACEVDDCSASGIIFYGPSGDDGAFLSVAVSQRNNKIQLHNVVKVKERACSVSSTSPARLATLIKTVRILGVDVYPVDIDLCDITEDSYEIPLTTF